LSETEPAISGLREAFLENVRADKSDGGGAFQLAGGRLTSSALDGPDGGFTMRSTLLALLFAGGIAALTAASASACPYHMTMAQGDQEQPAQTAQAQPAPAQNE
jgi:hypothetical protein